MSYGRVGPSVLPVSAVIVIKFVYEWLYSVIGNIHLFNNSAFSRKHVNPNLHSVPNTLPETAVKYIRLACMFRVEFISVSRDGAPYLYNIIRWRA